MATTNPPKTHLTKDPSYTLCGKVIDIYGYGVNTTTVNKEVTCKTCQVIGNIKIKPSVKTLGKNNEPNNSSSSELRRR